jgi:hypothetical protein
MMHAHRGAALKAYMGSTVQAANHALSAGDWLQWVLAQCGVGESATGRGRC